MVTGRCDYIEYKQRIKVMAQVYTSNLKRHIERHRVELVRVFADQGLALSPDKTLQIFRDYLDYLERELRSQDVSVGVSQLQEMLLAHADVSPD